jgi:hypothetical protein
MATSIHAGTAAQGLTGHHWIELNLSDAEWGRLETMARRRRQDPALLLLQIVQLGLVTAYPGDSCV